MPVKRTTRHILTSGLCLLPLIFFLFGLTVIPIWNVLRLSLTSPDVPGLSLIHFKTLLTQPAFLQAGWNTLVMALGSLLLELVLGLSLALVIASAAFGSGMLRTVMLLPLAVPTVVAGVMMSYLFSTSGWVNRVLLDLRIIEDPILWTGGGMKSLLMVMAADTWKVTPLVMLILLAGINRIDPQLYAAARVDGAGAWQRFRLITLPLLLPHITAAMIVRGIDAFRIFALPLILMGQNLKVIGTYAYLEYMEYQNLHLSAASAVILLGVILAFVCAYFLTTGKKSLEAG